MDSTQQGGPLLGLQPVTMQVLTTIIALGAAYSLSFLVRKSKASQYPLVGKDLGHDQRLKSYMDDAFKMYSEGYQKFKNSIWRITSPDGEITMLPLKYMDEIRKLPESIIDHYPSTEDRIESKYTGFRLKDSMLPHLIKADLTKALPRLNKALQAEIVQTVPDEIGSLDEWTPMKISDQILRIVAIVSGSVFMGSDLCRREEYMHASINFAQDIFSAGKALKEWSPWLRPIGQYFVPEIKRVHDHRARAHKFLVPVIKERREKMQRGEEMPNDVLQWMINQAGDWGYDRDEQIAEQQLLLSLASIFTTNITLMNTLYDVLGNDPSLIEDLRAEVEQVMEANDGELTTQSLFQMKLMDSVLRESQRTNIGNPSRFERVVRKDLVLQDGTFLPAGSRIAVDGHGVTRDPAYLSSPERYDGRRFAELRAGKRPDLIGYASPEQYQFISVTKENMGFGYGKHACPGRFFAANEIKMIFAHLLLGYDLAMPEDAAPGRYPNIIRGSFNMPDLSKKIMVKSRA